MAYQAMQKGSLKFPPDYHGHRVRVMLNKYGLKKTDNKKHQSLKRV